MEANDNEPSAMLADVDIEGVLRDLMEVAKVAIGPASPKLDAREAYPLLTLLLGIIEERMPEHLQAQDRRVVDAKVLRDLVLQLRLDSPDDRH